MAKIIFTWTREDISVPWFDITEENITQYFTEEEISNIIKPHKIRVESTAGYISRSIHDLDEFRHQIIFEYDTLENAQAAVWVITGADNQSGLIHRFLMDRKRKGLGLKYLINNVIEE